MPNFRLAVCGRPSTDLDPFCMYCTQDQDYNFPMDRKVELPDDVMRTKTFVLHPTTIEHATEQLEQVRLTAQESLAGTYVCI